MNANNTKYNTNTMQLILKHTRSYTDCIQNGIQAENKNYSRHDICSKCIHV